MLNVGGDKTFVTGAEDYIEGSKIVIRGVGGKGRRVLGIGSESEDCRGVGVPKGGEEVGGMEEAGVEEVG